MNFNIAHSLMGITLIGSEWVLWLLIILSVLSVAIIFERVAFFYRTHLNFNHFTEDLLVKMQANDWDGACQLAKQSSSLESQVFLRGMVYKEKGSRAMEENMEGFLAGERQNLDRGLVVLGTLGNNAPFIGLFGTVIGIIKAFHDLATNPAGGPSVVMAGISEALIATAVGIGVAIPAVIAFNAFNRIVKRRMANAEAVKKLVSAHFAASQG